MNRRDFLRSASILSGGLVFPETVRLFAEETLASGWRTFEVTTHVEVLRPVGATAIWVPVPLTSVTPFQRTLANKFTAEGGAAKIVESKADALGIVTVEFPAGVKPTLMLQSRVATKSIAVDLSASVRPPKVNRTELNHYLRPTKLLPTSGIVKNTAIEITRGATTDVEKARAIYEWIVENTVREPKTRGCGTGDIRFMLESGDLGGKCADLNALYVGLARSVGVPARDAYGIRVAPSKYGYKSLGTGSPNISKAQHCRAEFFARGYGWVPVDPADVRKVVLEEPPGNLPVTDEKVLAARKRLFGGWEMNWLAYNMGHDVKLPHANKAPKLPFLMYINAEADGELRDQLEPDSVKYAIASKEISV